MAPLKPDFALSGALIEKLRYLHRNPVARGLVAKPGDWPSCSFLHYATAEVGPVEIESEWTARRRERARILMTVTVRAAPEKPRSSKA